MPIAFTKLCQDPTGTVLYVKVPIEVEVLSCVVLHHPVQLQKVLHSVVDPSEHPVIYVTVCVIGLHLE